MASLIKIKNRTGYRYQIQVCLQGRRKTLSLDSGYSDSQARRVQTHLEAIAESLNRGLLLPPQEVAWTESLTGTLRSKIASLGLIPKSYRVTNREIWTLYLDTHTEIKDSTAKSYGVVRRRFLKYFGEEGNPDDLTVAQAQAWKKEQLASGYATASVAASIQRTRTIFSWGVKERYLRRNIFSDVPRGSFENPDRLRFISPEETARILDACPDQNWRVLIALARWGGLRNPSETLLVRWQDINWSRNRFLVHSPKTAGKAGHETRLVPLFPELRRELDRSWDQAGEGEVYVVGSGSARQSGASLRKRFFEIVFQAGLEPWPRIFHNLRASRSNELFSRYPWYIASAWLGQTAGVATRHYLQALDCYFDEASATGLNSSATAGSDPSSPQASASNSRREVLSETVSEAITDDTAAVVEETAAKSAAVTSNQEVSGGVLTTGRKRP